MQVIRTFYSPEEAYTAVSLLKAHGFHAHLLDDAILSMMPLDSVALGGYRVAVLPHEAGQAVTLIESHETDTQSQGSQQYFGDEYDPAHDDQPKQLSFTTNLRFTIILAAIIVVGLSIFWNTNYW